MWEKPSDAAAEAAVWGLIETEAKKRKDAAREWLTERMGPDLLAVEANANGQTVGRASYVKGKEEFKVTDDEAFAAFVAEFFPDEVTTVVNVNSAFQKSLLSRVVLKVQAGEEPVVLDPDTGVPVPGVQLRTSRPYVSVSKSKDAREKVADLLSAGRLSLEGIKAVESSWEEDTRAGAIGGKP